MSDVKGWHQDVLRLMSPGSPFLLMMAGHRIVVQADCCTCGDDERRAAVLDAARIWIATYMMMQSDIQRLTKELVPQIMAARDALKGDERPATDDTLDPDHEEDLPFEKTAKPRPGKRPVKPSRVLVSKPFTDRDLKDCRLYFEIEDDLRMLCFYAPFMKEDGDVPAIPLAMIGKAKVTGYGVRTLYAYGQVQRPWAGPGETSLDRAMTEDLIILLSSYEPWLSSRDRELRFIGLSPFLRGVTKERTLASGWEAAGSLMGRGVIAASPDGHWSLGNADQKAVEVLTQQWIEPHEFYGDWGCLGTGSPEAP
jgi:hypothetical protein